MTEAEKARDLGAYFKRCKATDWFYQMADDHRAYKRGQLQCVAAVVAADTPEKTEILTAFETCHRSRMPYRNEADALPWPVASDFNLGEADLEA